MNKKSVLLLGPRRTGKSALIRNQIKADHVYNLLQSDIFQAVSARPSLIREALKPTDRLVVIDEIQKQPALMDEVHDLIESRGIRFLLTGSSARKLRRSHTSLMAGRAKTLQLHPFCYPEIADQFDLNRVLHYGSLPPVYLADDPWDELRSYAGDYLKEEILAEAIARRIENFSRFLVTAATSNAELLNYESIANDAQVPARTVREYYAVLTDTLIGSLVEPFRAKKVSRKAVAKNKFYFFDLGVLNSLLGRKTLPRVGAELGGLFESWIYLELKAYLDYTEREEPIQFWRTHTGHEVDFLVGGRVAIEVKMTELASERDLRGLRELGSEHALEKKIVVSRDKKRRKLQGVDIMPCTVFLEALWDGEII
ncbi:MAG: ATP-binding protein [Deltaproteobacteria bacterium]|nr:ATP-binding protein [Deltaproteobacteria bacterium]